MGHTPGKPAYADLESVRHSLIFYAGLVATDRPDLHNLDTDRDKSTVFEIDTQNEVAMIDEAITVRNDLLEALENIMNGLLTDPHRDMDEVWEHAIRKARAAIAAARGQS